MINLNSEHEPHNFLGEIDNEIDEKFELIDNEDDDDENVNPSFILETLQAGRNNKTLSSPTQIKKRKVNSVSPIHQLKMSQPKL